MIVITSEIRIEPADQDGIHLVQVEGGERIYIQKDKINKLIDDLKKVNR